MLLRHTPTEVVERQALTINPAKTCQPIGAMYAALGIHRCLPHSHGSQGCCSYHRSTLTRHYKEPVMAGTSSFTEGSSVFGGGANLETSFENIFSIYNPDVIAVHTTCLSETIGDDIPQIVDKARTAGKIGPDKHVIYCNTPSYVGSQVTGFANMCKGIVTGLAQSTTDQKIKTQVNVMPGWVEPADMREVGRLVREMGLSPIVYPDTSDVLDAPTTGKYDMYPKGGATVAQVKASGDSALTLALGPITSGPAARELETKCNVPAEIMGLPIGIRGTDRFIAALRKQNGGHVPQSILNDRGRLIDVIADMHQYLYGKTVAMWGDPDQLVALSEFLVDMDMRPKYIVTGTPGKKFLKRMADVLGDQHKDAQVRQGGQADMFLMHQWIKNDKVDLLIGNTYGKYIARDENIPFLRHGFPIVDRVGHSYFPTVGYQGGIRLVEKILNLFLDKQDNESSEESFELTM